MCHLNYHICSCGEEYTCQQHDAECPVMNGYVEVCAKCEYWAEDAEQEYKRKLRHNQEEEEWVKEHGWD